MRMLLDQDLDGSRPDGADTSGWGTVWTNMRGGAKAVRFKLSSVNYFDARDMDDRLLSALGVGEPRFQAAVVA
jgi:hypothetical protein